MALQTKDFTVTAKSADGTNTFTFILRVTENSIDVKNNTSHVTVQAILKQSSSGTCFAGKMTGVSCTANSQQLFSSYVARSLIDTKEHIYYTWEEDMPHNDNGSLTLLISGQLWLQNPGSNQPSKLKITNGKMTLTDIPRYSVVGASDAYIGSNSTIVISAPNANCTHSIQYTFGSLTGYILSDGSRSDTPVRVGGGVISFPVPEEFYLQMPDSPSATCNLTVITYQGSVQTGKGTASFRVFADKEVCAPVLTASVADSNPAALALTGDENRLVRFFSDALCQAEAVGQKGASIVSVSVNGSPMETTLTLFKVETGSYEFIATDSRGFQTKVTVQKELIPYVQLTCNPTARRTAPTTGQVELRLSGNGWKGSFGVAENTLIARCRTSGGDWQAVALEHSEDHSYSGSILLEGLDYTHSYVIEVDVADSVDTVTAQTAVSRGIPVFDWGEDYFNFHVPVRFGAGATGLT